MHRFSQGCRAWRRVPTARCGAGGLRCRRCGRGAWSAWGHKHIDPLARRTLDLAPITTIANIPPCLATLPMTPPQYGRSALFVAAWHGLFSACATPPKCTRRFQSDLIAENLRGRGVATHKMWNQTSQALSPCHPADLQSKGWFHQSPRNSFPPTLRPRGSRPHSAALGGGRRAARRPWRLHSFACAQRALLHRRAGSRP